MNNEVSPTMVGDVPLPNSDCTSTDGHAAKGCPVCSGSAIRVWRHAPDRLHGRRITYTLKRCDDCSLVWLDGAPRPDEMQLHYTDAYNRLISRGGRNSPLRWPFRKQKLEQYKQGGALLDIGCSSGSFLEFMHAHNWALYGIEMSQEEAEAARASSGAEVFVGTAAEAKFQEQMFDVITCFDVLEHLYDPRRVMENISTWLKPSGIFYVLIPNIDSAEARIFRTYWHGLELPRHLFHYTPASLEHLANSVGLQTVSIETKRNSAVGTSMRYVCEDLLRHIGIQMTPVAYRSEPNLAWKAVRKLGRLTLLRLLLAFAPMIGGGESIHAVFRKPQL